MGETIVDLSSPHIQSLAMLAPFSRGLHQTSGLSAIIAFGGWSRIKHFTRERPLRSRAECSFRRLGTVMLASGYMSVAKALDQGPCFNANSLAASAPATHRSSLMKGLRPKQVNFKLCSGYSSMLFHNPPGVLIGCGDWPLIARLAFKCYYLASLL